MLAEEGVTDLSEYSYAGADEGELAADIFVEGYAG